MQTSKSIQEPSVGVVVVVVKGDESALEGTAHPRTICMTTWVVPIGPRRPEEFSRSSQDKASDDTGVRPPQKRNLPFSGVWC